jgi:hypothetical protein
MDPSRPKRILDDWTAVAKQARRPDSPPRPVVIRSGLPGATLAGASLVIVVGLAIVGMLLGRTTPDGGVGSSPSPRNPVASATRSSASPSGASCQPERVDARSTLW